MNPRTIALTLICVLWIASANAEESPKWLCIADAATGFSYKNGRWVSTNFNVDDNRFIVFKKQYSLVYEVRKMGYHFGSSCRKDDPDEEGWIQCEGILETWRMNIFSLRYLRANLIGYVIEDLDEDERLAKASTPFIEIGRCSPL